MSRNPTDIVPLQLRLTEALRRKIERAAEKNGRSLNSEMVQRLTQSFVLEDVGNKIESELEQARQINEETREKMRQMREEMEERDRQHQQEQWKVIKELQERVDKQSKEGGE
jgi:hypothetical protein